MVLNKQKRHISIKYSVVTIAAAALLLPACADNQPQANNSGEQSQQVEKANEQKEENLEKVADKPEQMVGKTVTVKGKVDQVYSAR